MKAATDGRSVFRSLLGTTLVSHFPATLAFEPPASPVCIELAGRVLPGRVSVVEEGSPSLGAAHGPSAQHSPAHMCLPPLWP